MISAGMARNQKANVSIVQVLSMCELIVCARKARQSCDMLHFLNSQQRIFLREKYQIETFLQLSCLTPLPITAMYDVRLWNSENPEKFLLGNVRELVGIFHSFQKGNVCQISKIRIPTK